MLSSTSMDGRSLIKHLPRLHIRRNYTQVPSNLRTRNSIRSTQNTVKRGSLTVSAEYNMSIYTDVGNVVYSCWRLQHLGSRDKLYPSENVVHSQIVCVDSRCAR